MTFNQSATMQQWREAKAKHPNMLLLFLMGDFYELFNEDTAAASVLGLTVMNRGGVPMAGFPHHQLEGYLQKLLLAGHRVAVCEQVEELPKGAKARRVVTHS